MAINATTEIIVVKVEFSVLTPAGVVVAIIILLKGQTTGHSLTLEGR
jgi:hypothetical protein